jgi:hypothetical protein
MTRQIAPDEAHSIAPDVVADKRLPVRPRAVESGSAAAAGHTQAPAAPLDHATIRAIVAGIMLAMFLSALEQTSSHRRCPPLARVSAMSMTCPGL